MTTASRAMERIDLRQRRSEALTAALMAELQDILHGEQFRDVHERLFSVLYENSVSWVTEEERRNLGLEPRDGLGWTPSERVEEERRRLEAMLLTMSVRHMMPIQAAE